MKHVICNLCGKDDAEDILSGSDRWITRYPTIFNLVRCRNCSLYYINPQPTMEELAKFYPTDYAPYSTGYQSLHYGFLLNLLRRIKQKIMPTRHIAITTMSPAIDKESPKKILDFGCGGGYFLRSLGKQHPSWTLYGFDISTNPLTEKLSDHIKVYRGQAQNLLNYFTKKDLDIIYLNNSLEHLNDPTQIMRLLTTLLNDNGEFIIEVPNIDSIKFKVFGKNFSSLDIPRHLYMFNPKTLRMLLEKNGFTVRKISISGSPKSLLRSFYFFLHLDKRRFNPLLFRIASLTTKLTGNKLNDDVITITAVKN